MNRMEPFLSNFMGRGAYCQVKCFLCTLEEFGKKTPRLFFTAAMLIFLVVGNSLASSLSFAGNTLNLHY